jgi:hypothetical protein
MKALTLALPALLVAWPAWAQDLTRDELLQALKERDAAIAALEKRVDALEAERAATPVATAVAADAASAARPASAPAPPPAQASAGASAAKDDDVALQALSRTLVQRGALVLPLWSVELSPGLAYSHTQTQGLALVDSNEGVSTVDSRRLRDDSLIGAETLRVGLPWDSQLQLRVPGGWMRESFALGDGSHGTTDQFGLGDIEVELSHQLLRAHGWIPDLVGAVNWKFPTGTDPFRATVPATATGGGVHQVKGRLTAMESADPLVFFSTLSYAYNFGVHEHFGEVRPGDAWTWEIGTVLAANPQTSLTLGFSQEWRGQTRVDGAPIAGSDGVASLLEFGVGRVLSPNALLDVSVGVGVTRDAPDYQIQVSLPIRFR